MKRTRVPLAVLAFWLAGSASGGEEAAVPHTGLRVETNPTEATWSVSWQGTPLVTAAKYGLAHEETLPIEVDFNYLKFRMYQEGGACLPAVREKAPCPSATGTSGRWVVSSARS